MADHSKASWPKTPDGTTDWEAVFEDPHIGFVTLMKRGQTPDAVEKTAAVILKKLFSRRNDLDLCKQHIHRLETTISTHKDNLPAIYQDIAVQLREVKIDRIQLARAFVERKAAGAAIDRRSGMFWKAGGLFQLKVLLPVGAVLMSAIGAIFYLMMGSPSPEPNTHADKFGQSTGSAAATYQRPSSLEPTGTTDPTEIPPPIQPAKVEVWLKVIKWPLLPTGSRFTPKYYSVTLFVKDTDTARSVCGRVPSISDRIIVAFSNGLPQDRDARIDEVTNTEDQLKPLLNNMFGENYIDHAKLATYGTANFKAATRSPFCKYSNPE